MAAKKGRRSERGAVFRGGNYRPRRGKDDYENALSVVRPRKFPEKVSSLGEIRLSAPGEHKADLRATVLKETCIGIRIPEVRLTPATR